MNLPFKINVILLLSFFISINIVKATDIAAGKSKANSCVTCHGFNGVSINSNYPNLAGQKPAYIEAQLNAFKSNTRNAPIMQSIAAKLNKQDIKNISAFLASLSPGRANTGDILLAKQGEAIANQCKGCHGSRAEGIGSIPRLAGQHAVYLKKQLLNFKANKRFGGPMSSIASSLTEEQIDQLAAYLNNL